MWTLTSLFRPFWSPFQFLYNTLSNLLASVYLRASSKKKDLEQGDGANDGILPAAQPPVRREYPKATTYIIIPEGQKAPEPKYGEVIFFTKGQTMCSGGTAIIEKLPSGDVLKTPTPNPWCPSLERDHFRNMRLEAKVYNLVGKHPRVPRLIDWDPKTCCLTMEYLANGTLKDYVLSNNESIALQQRLLWRRQAAEGLGVLHDKQVIHCDIAARNFLLDSELNLKIADFGGASVCGSELSASAGTRFLPPNYDFDAMPVYDDDIFGLGSLIYFIMTGSYPYKELPRDEVEKLYGIDQFPDVSSISCGPIITQCWNRQMVSCHAVCDALNALEDENPLPTP